MILCLTHICDLSQINSLPVFISLVLRLKDRRKTHGSAEERPVFTISKHMPSFAWKTKEKHWQIPNKLRNSVDLRPPRAVIMWKHPNR